MNRRDVEAAMLMDGCTWVIVADGGRARVLEERRRGVALREQATLRHSEADDHLPGDRPGRVRESVGAAHHRIERRSTPHDEGERQFLRKVAAKVEEGAARREFDHLIVFAPPRALGVFRSALSENVSRRVVAEAPLDVVDEGLAAIAERVERLRRGA